ncbi:signal peptidase I [Herbiconiux ginsengi]|uniref:Signal peptidase I n=1 Tax=Herbiconiux ginsengi TaxID=381665 RepID=A0A1H3Q945_9MICO|nr:signal peptidase I [Herbiconiux ginsengi]SDZ09803.1 signal peptidase, endoplasmic reticulum-type [Herbiconiux ginsengi]
MTELATRGGPGKHSRVPSSAPVEKSLAHYLGTAVSAAFLVLVLALAVLTIALPALVGGRPLTVLTQSMEPGLPPGTLIVVHPVPVGEIRVGDVLTYQIESGKPGVVSHRVIEKTISTAGSTTFVTRGDNNDLADEDPVQEVQIVGVLWYSIPMLGWVNNAVNGEWRGFVVPVVVGGLFGYAAWMFFSGIRDHRRRRRT